MPIKRRRQSLCHFVTRELTGGSFIEGSCANSKSRTYTRLRLKSQIRLKGGAGTSHQSRLVRLGGGSYGFRSQFSNYHEPTEVPTVNAILLCWQRTWKKLLRLLSLLQHLLKTTKTKITCKVILEALLHNVSSTRMCS